MSRVRRSVLSAGSSLLNSGVGLVVGFLSTPILLRLLGDERVGVYRVALEWIGYLALLDLGLTGALQATLARVHSSGDRRGTVAVLQRGMKSFIAIGVLHGIAYIVLLTIIPNVMKGLSAGLKRELVWGIAIGAAAVFWMPFGVFRPLLESTQRSYWVHLAITMQSLAITLFCIVFAWVGWGLPGQFAAGVIGGGIFAIWMLVVVWRRYPELWGVVKDAPEVPIERLQWPMFVFSIFARMSMLSDGIILVQIMGPIAVVRYYVTQRLMQTSQTQVLAIGNSTWAALAELHHTGARETFNTRLVQLTRWTALLSCGLIGPLAVLNGPLVATWVGVERFGGVALTWVSFAFLTLHSLFSLWCWCLVGTGKVRIILPLVITGAVVNIAVSIAGTFWLGVVGPALGSLANFVLVNLWWCPLLLKREFGTSIRALFWAIVPALLLALPVGLLEYGVSRALSVETSLLGRWMRFALLAGEVAAAAALYAALAWTYVIPENERAEVLARWKRTGGGDGQTPAEVLQCAQIIAPSQESP